VTLPQDPTLLVEIAFADSPLTVSPTWTNVTQWVRDGSVAITRGKQSELETFGQSSCSFVLNNRDRRFDPDYGSSPYNLTGRKQVRVSAVWSGTTYRLWRGVLESFPQAYANGNVDAVVPVTAYDLLTFLAEERLEDAAWVYATETIYGSGLDYRIMTNGEWIPSGGGASLYKRRGVTAVGSSLALGPGTPVVFDGSTAYSINAPTASPITTGGYQQFAFSCWVQTESVGASAANWCIIMEQVATSGQSSIRIGIDSNGYLRVVSGTATAMSTSKINDGAPHHIVVVYQDTLYFAVYVDGRNATDPDTYYASGLVESYGSISWVGGGSGLNTSDTRLVGTVQDVWTWAGSNPSNFPSAAEVLTLYQLASGSYVESTADRADRILDLASVPAGLVDLTTREVGEVAEIDTFDQTATALLQTVADSEQGRLFCASDGKVTLQDRYWWTSGGATVQATFSDDLADLRFANVTADRPLRDVQNDITVTGSAGVRARSEDVTSQTNYGRRSRSVSTILARQSLVDDMAVGLLSLRKDAVTRLGQIVVKPGRDLSWATVLGLEIGDRIVVEYMPVRRVATTSQVSRTLLVERIDWRLSQGDWTLTLLGSPVPTFSPFILDSSSLDGTDLLGF
tara:strand:- start:1584 stop:3461 length:1878 start_codon:yes stop_codon:yes gene_type:complete